MKKYVLIIAKQIEKKKELNKIIQLNHINFIKLFPQNTENFTTTPSTTA